MILYKNYTAGEYPKYNNYEAINIDKTKEMLVDYNVVMGAAINFLDKYNLTLFTMQTKFKSVKKLLKNFYILLYIFI